LLDKAGAEKKLLILSFQRKFMTVLIVTFSRDNESIPLVIKAIETMGKKAFRFDTDRFPTDVKVESLLRG
jgi:hypothetical protein